MSLIRAVTIENFKALGEKGAKIEFAPVTLLFGPNSAGKSSIIQALHYANEVLARDNTDADRTLLGGRAIELGGFRNMVHQRDVRRSIRFVFDLDLSETDLPVYRMDYVTSYADVSDWADGVESASVGLAIAWSDQLDRPCVCDVDIAFNNGVSINISCDEYGGNAVLWLVTGHADTADASSSAPTDEMCELLQELLPRVINGDYLDLGPPVSLYKVSVGGVRDALARRGKPLDFPHTLWRDSGDTPEHREFTEQLSRLAVGPLDLLREELAKLIYLGPLREIPERHIQHARSPDPSRWSAGLAAWDLLAADPGLPLDGPEFLIGRVNEWLAAENRFNSGYRIEAENYCEIRIDSPLGVALAGGELLDVEQAHSWYEKLPVHSRVRLVDASKGVSLSPQDLGTGLSQALPILVAALQARNTMLLIEQPELHIHPAMQVEMGDLFIETARARELCFLIETHSEHLLLRILRRIRETTAGEVPPGEPECRGEDVAVYFIEPDAAGKDTRVTRLRITDDGDFLDPWPRGFFEERDSELF